MVKKWEFQSIVPTPTEEKIHNFISAATGYKFPTLSKKLTYFFNLYEFLSHHKNEDPEVVASMVTENGVPIFSTIDMKMILDIIQKQTTHEYCNMDTDNTNNCIANQLKTQYGGGDPPKPDAKPDEPPKTEEAPKTEPKSESKSEEPTPEAKPEPESEAKPELESEAKPEPEAKTESEPEVKPESEPEKPTPEAKPEHEEPKAEPEVVIEEAAVVDPTYNANDDMFGATKRPGFVDKPPSTFYDKVARKLQSIVPKASHKWDGFFWYVFLLYNLENMDIFGPTLSIILDSYVLGTRVLIDGLDSFVPIIVSILAGIFPGGGIAGPIAGKIGVMIIGDILLLATVIVSISRRQFGDAFKNSIQMIPFIGDFLLTFALTAETQSQRINAYRHKYVDMLGSVSPRLERYADYWVPKLEVVTEPPPPPLTLTDVKEDVVTKAMEVSGVSNVLDQAQSLTADPLKGVGQITGDVQQKAQEKAEQMIASVGNTASAAIAEKTEAATAAAAAAIAEKTEAATAAASEAPFGDQRALANKVPATIKARTRRKRRHK